MYLRGMRKTGRGTAKGKRRVMGRDLVLIIEDDAATRRVVRRVVEGAGMQAAEADTGQAGLRLFYDRRPALVVLDITLPGLDGWEVLDRIRDLAATPVIILTGRDGELEKVRALRAGADDYVTKPFGGQELGARLEALLRRSRNLSDTTFEVHRDDLLEVDFEQRRVLAAGHELELTPTEFRLVASFVRRPNRILSHDQLLDEVWGAGAEGSRSQVKVYVGYLRRKLAAAGAGDPFETIRGFGYRYNPRRAALAD
jgi:DNA-binding response OmpR family regulator